MTKCFYYTLKQEGLHKAVKRLGDNLSNLTADEPVDAMARAFITRQATGKCQGL